MMLGLCYLSNYTGLFQNKTHTNMLSQMFSNTLLLSLFYVFKFFPARIWMQRKLVWRFQQTHYRMKQLNHHCQSVENCVHFMLMVNVHMVNNAITFMVRYVRCVSFLSWCHLTLISRINIFRWYKYNRAMKVFCVYLIVVVCLFYTF